MSGPGDTHRSVGRLPVPVDQTRLLGRDPGVFLGRVVHEREPEQDEQEREAALDVEHLLPAQHGGQQARERHGDHRPQRHAWGRGGVSARGQRHHVIHSSIYGTELESTRSDA